MSQPNESDSSCDCCEKPALWEDLLTGDDGETWVCLNCYVSLRTT